MTEDNEVEETVEEVDDDEVDADDTEYVIVESDEDFAVEDGRVDWWGEKTFAWE